MDIIRKILLGLLVIIILILIEFLKPLRAEERKPLFHVGAYAGMNFNYHYSSFTRLGEEYYNCCPQFESAKGNGFAFGGLFEIPIKERLYFGARIGFSQFDGKFSPKEFIGNTEVREQTPPYETVLIQSAQVVHSIDSKLSNIGLEPYIGFNAFKGLHTFAGFRLSYLYSPEFSQQEKLLVPNNVTFLDGRRIRNDFYNEEIPKSNPLQFHGLVGIGYDLPIGPNSYITPEVKYYIPFTNISNVDWKASAFQIAAAVKFPIYPAEPIAFRDTVIIRDTTVIVESGIQTEFVRLKNTREKQSIVRTDAGKVDRTEITQNYERVVPKTEDLRLDFAVFGVNRNGERQQNPLVIIEEIETEEGFPLLPYVFFPQGNSLLGNTSMNMISKQDAEDFRENQLRWNTMDIYQDLLNIVGKRLRDNPRANITLTGTNNNTDTEKGNTSLSLARAFGVRDYLVSVWDIAPSRITTNSVNLPAKPTNPLVIEGIQENARVEISSNDRNILAPVYLREVLRESNPPLIEIHPVIQTSAGIDEYLMEISQDNSILRRNRGTGLPEKYDWNIEQAPVPMLDAPALISWKVTDNAKQTATKEQEIKIEQKTIKTKRTQIEGDYRVERYALILFDFDKSTILDNHKQVLDYIKSKIMPNSIVTISGYADRTGTSEYNRELARRRSEEVSKYFAIPATQYQLNPIGSDELIFDNDLPEGRSYSRTVRIEIRTPVGGR